MKKQGGDKKLERVTITIETGIMDEVRLHNIKNVSKFVSESIREKLKSTCKEKLSDTLANFPRKKPLEASISSIRNGRENELS